MNDRDEPQIGPSDAPWVPAPDIEPEAARADRHKEAIRSALKPVIALMEAARADGFYTEIPIGLDAFGRYTLQGVTLVKRF